MCMLYVAVIIMLMVFIRRQSQQDHEAHIAALGKEEAEMEKVRISRN